VITGLDYQDPTIDPHLQGGYYAIPKLSMDGALICGDSAGMVAMPMLKGVHYTIKSGILAAETLFEALVKDNFRPHNSGSTRPPSRSRTSSRICTPRATSAN